MSKALELWKELIDYLGESYWITDDYGRTECFFCGGPYPTHNHDCFYLQALKLVDDDAWGDDDL